MLRFLAVPAACLALACLALAVPAAAGGAGDGSHLGPRYAALPVETSPVLRGSGAAEPGLPGAGRPDSRRAEPASAREEPAALKTQAEASKSWCPPERRVGTGAGFCLIN